MNKQLEQKYEEALKRIANPIRWMRNNLKEGESLNGGMAVEMSQSANYLKNIAEEALKEISALKSQESEPIMDDYVTSDHPCFGCPRPVKVKKTCSDCLD